MVFGPEENGRPGPGASFIRAPGPLCRDAGSNLQPPRNWCSTSLRNVDHDMQDAEMFDSVAELFVHTELS